MLRTMIIGIRRNAVNVYVGTCIRLFQNRTHHYLKKRQSLNPPDRENKSTPYPVEIQEDQKPACVTPRGEFQEYLS